MTMLHLTIRSLRYHARTLVPAAAALAVATAVIAGALVIGRSARESLRDMALARLGTTRFAVVSQGLFSDGLGPRMAGATLLVERCAVLGERTNEVAPAVNVIGIDSSVDSIFPGQQPAERIAGGVAINATLAKAIGASVGDDLIVTLSRQQSAPLDSLFAQRSRGEALVTMRLPVSAVMSPGSFGDFALDAATTPRYNLFVDRRALADASHCAGCANVLLIDSVGGASVVERLRRSATLADRGLRLRQDFSAGGLILESDRLLMREGEVNRTLRVARDAGWIAKRLSVFLADSVVGRRVASYAVIGARDGLQIPSGCVQVNRWAADDLGVSVGSPVRIRCLWPAADGSYRSVEHVRRVESVLPMSGLAADANLTPRFEGITDASRISDWQAPFPVDLGRVTPRDEAYWSLYRAAPRLTATIDDARAYWSQANPGGDPDWVTGILLMPPPGVSRERQMMVADALLAAGLDPSASGLVVRPVRVLALRSALASNDFASLFLGLGFFVIVSAAAAFGLVMRLSIERRATEVGLLKACGFDEGRIARLMLAEAAVVSACGAVAGSLLGAAYAWGILGMLAGPWSGADAGAALSLHLEFADLAAGGAAGWGIGIIAGAWTLRGLLGRTPLTLLRDLPVGGWHGARRGTIWRTLLLVALPLAALAACLHRGGDREGAFLTAGCLLLAWFLAVAAVWLARVRAARTDRLSMRFVALRNCAMRERHSLLVMGLIASATFLLVAIGANSRHTDARDVYRRASGSGGFSLVATSSLPMPIDFATAKGRARLGFSPDDEAAFAGTTVVPLFMSDGEDAGCRNLAHPVAPRILGVGKTLIDRGGFSPETEYRSGWPLLRGEPLPGPIPAFADADTAEWILGVELGGFYRHPASRRPLRIAGLLHHSLFSGELLVPQTSFRSMFPSERAPRYFLIQTPPGREEAVASALRRNLGETGLDVRRSRDLLDSVDRVQNSYLAAFRALGSLGLLLGVAALGAVIVRGARERRRELAAMQAIGFGRPDIARLLVCEAIVPLLAGLIAGALSALVAVAPNLSASGGMPDLPATLALVGLALVCGVAVSMVAGITSAGGCFASDLRAE